MAHELVFVIDDELPMIEIIAQTLTDSGFTAQPFHQAAHALQASKDSAPLCVFLDVRMPEMDGLAFLREFRKSNGTKDVPVILMTGYSEPGIYREALQYHITDFLTKPFAPDDVREALAKALGRDQEFLDKFFAVITHRLREARQRLGLRQSEVAQRCGLSTSQVSQIELRQSAPSVTTLLRLCKALNMTISDLVAGF